MMKQNLQRAFRLLLKNKITTLAFILLTLILIILLLAPWIAPYGAEEQNIAHRLLPGFWDAEHAEGHLLGTDNLGRDTFSRLILGGRTTLSIALQATTIGLFFGTLFGLLAGYYPRLDSPIMRVMDILFTFPGILLAMLIIAIFGTSERNTVLAIAIWAIPNFARMIRSRTLSIKNEEYITSERALGAHDGRILFKHILPNCIPTIIVIATMRLAFSIISISTLSYLGVGVPAPKPEWGGMIFTAKDYMWERPSLIIIPGLAVMVTVISINLIGDKLSEILTPGLKDRI